MARLNVEEKEILEAFEKGKLKRPRNAKKIIEQHKEIAEATFKKNARINIRLTTKDLRALQVLALKEGIPYQTLVSSVLHKYVDGQLTDKTANKDN